MLHNELNSTLELCLLKFVSLVLSLWGEVLLNSPDRNEDVDLLPATLIDFIPLFGLYKCMMEGFSAVMMSIVFVMYLRSFGSLGGL